MNTKDLITMAAAALAVFQLYDYLTKRNATGGSAAPYTTKIMDWGGWQYFSDGTSIGPDGSYYYQGQQVYKAPTGGFVGAANPANNGGAGLWTRI